MSLHLLGAETTDKGAQALNAASGSGWGSMIGPILQAAGGLAQGGISIYEQEQAKKKADADAAQKKTDDAKKVQAAIAADAAAAKAIAQAAASAASKGASAATDAVAAEVAQRAQDRAAAGLGEDGNAKRTEAAETQLALAAAKARTNPKDVYQAALVKGWQAVLNKTSNAQIVTSDAPKPMRESGGASWFTRPAIGPVPGWGVVAGGVGIAGLAALAFKKFA